MGCTLYDNYIPYLRTVYFCVPIWEQEAHSMKLVDQSELNFVKGIFRMVGLTSLKSTHESVPFKHSVVRLYIAALC